MSLLPFEFLHSHVVFQCINIGSLLAIGKFILRQAFIFGLFQSCPPPPLSNDEVFLIWTNLRFCVYIFSSTANFFSYQLKRRNFYSVAQNHSAFSKAREICLFQFPLTLVSQMSPLTIFRFEMSSFQWLKITTKNWYYSWGIFYIMPFQWLKITTKNWYYSWGIFYIMPPFKGIKAGH